MLSKYAADCILAEARINGITVTEYDDTQGLILAATDILEEARTAWLEGARGEVIKTIIKLADDIISEEINNDKPETVNNLPVPKDYGDVVPEFPRDISVVSDKELRRLHAEFAAMLARANWLVAVEETDEISARQVVDLKHAQAIRRAAGTIDSVTNKAKTVPMLEAEAADDEEVREWRTKQTKHFVQIKLLKALRDNYQMICERISREWSMREKEQTVQVT